KERTGLLVARPSRGDDARLLGSAATVNKLFDAVVFSYIEFPRVTGRVTADLGGIFHCDQLSRTFAQRQFVHTLIRDRGARVPISVERKQEPIIIVGKTGVDVVLHGVGLAAELRFQVSNVARLTVL